MKEWNTWVKHWKRIPLSLNWIFQVSQRMIELLWIITYIVLNIFIDNKFGDDGLRYLSESLKVNTALTLLDLSGKPANAGIHVMYSLHCVVLLTLCWISTHSKQGGSRRLEVFEWIIKSKFQSHWIESFLYAREWLNYCYVLLTLCWISTHS